MNSRTARTILFFFAAFLVGLSANAQSLLNKQVTITANKEKLGTVLKKIEKQGGFYFSYTGNIVNPDSLVSISIQNRTVRQTLDVLFEGRLEYEETEKHIILKRGAQQVWYASGYVYDKNTGEKLSYASVYERRQLVSTMTNEQGYYRLKLKDRSQPAQISISKSWYIDTTITVRPEGAHELNVSILPRENNLDTIIVTPDVDGSWLSKLFVSSRQRMGSINMSKFFVNMPVQASFTPGLGTHGKMSGQVVNKFSFNVVGGYTAGTNGAEIGLLFNINKKDAKYTQVAGAFNMVGGNVYGTQIGGLYNQVMDSVEGVQISGGANNVKGPVKGIQIGGIYNNTRKNIHGTQISGGLNIIQRDVQGGQVGGFGNYAQDSVTGTQVSGFGNYSGGTTNGVQVTGFGNYSRGNVDGGQVSAGINIAGEEMNGAQIGGLFNYARRMNGFQLGFFNYADTSTGFSFGFLNIVRKGYHKASISANEVFNTNAAFKTGNSRFYSVLFLSANLGNQQAYSYGYGIGTEIKLAKRLALSPELSAHYLYMGGGAWDVNILNRATLNLQYKCTGWLTVFAGPAYSIYYTDQQTFFKDYKSHPAPAGYKIDVHNAHTTGWIGWSAGINLF